MYPGIALHLTSAKRRRRPGLMLAGSVHGVNDRKSRLSSKHTRLNVHQDWKQIEITLARSHSPEKLEFEINFIMIASL